VVKSAAMASFIPVSIWREKMEKRGFAEVVERMKGLD